MRVATHTPSVARLDCSEDAQAQYRSAPRVKRPAPCATVNTRETSSLRTPVYRSHPSSSSARFTSTRPDPTPRTPCSARNFTFPARLRPHRAYGANGAIIASPSVLPTSVLRRRARGLAVTSLRPRPACTTWVFQPRQSSFRPRAGVELDVVMRIRPSRCARTRADRGASGTSDSARVSSVAPTELVAPIVLLGDHGPLRGEPGAEISSPAPKKSVTL